MLRATYLFVFGLVVTFATLACCQETSVDNALRISQRTGKPVFAIASRKNCPPCRALKARVEQHLKSSPHANQVVYLRVDLDGPQWRSWSRQFPHQGTMLPLVYLIRADKTKVYGQSNTLPGEQLEKFLTQGIAHCGKSFTESDIKKIEVANASVKQAIDNNKVDVAIQWLNTNSIFTSTQSSESYAAAAIESKRLQKLVSEKSETFVAKHVDAIAKELDENQKDPFPAIYKFVSLERNFANNKQAAKHFSTIAVKLATNTNLRNIWSDATKVFDANQTLVASKSVEQKKTAIQILNSLSRSDSAQSIQQAALNVIRRNAATVARLETTSSTK
jgi:hypothetical protein